MNNFLYLNLPNDPLKNKISIVKAHRYRKFRDTIYNILSPEVLSDHVVQLLSQSGLDLDYVAIFKTYGWPGTDTRRIIHTDITWNGEWKKVSFGINWEIGSESNSRFQWWEFDSTTPEIYPPAENQKSEILAKLSGIHHGARWEKGIPLAGKLIEEVSTKFPLLARTDIPHRVLYTGFERLSMSIRFRQLISWQEAQDAFKYLVLPVGIEPTSSFEPPYQDGA